MMPNVDAMTFDEIVSFRYNLLRLIKEYRDDWDTENALHLLWDYTTNLLKARTRREAGDIELAVALESLNDQTFKELPEWARW